MEQLPRGSLGQTAGMGRNVEAERVDIRRWGIQHECLGTSGEWLPVSVYKHRGLGGKGRLFFLYSSPTFKTKLLI